jgi:hypothetical protein
VINAHRDVRVYVCVYVGRRIGGHTEWMIKKTRTRRSGANVGVHKENTCGQSHVVWGERNGVTEQQIWIADFVLQKKDSEKERKKRLYFSLCSGRSKSSQRSEWVSHGENANSNFWVFLLH